MQTKICSVCKQEKPLDDYYIRRDRNKPIARCSDCNRIATQKSRAKMTPEQKRKNYAASARSYIQHARNGDIRPIINHKFSGIRGTAKFKNVPFDIDIDYLVNIFKQQNGLCYYTGRKMDINSGLGTTHVSLKNRPYQFSLDRLIPEKGYVKGNVVWCGWLVNTCKNMFTEQQFYEFCKEVLDFKLQKLHLDIDRTFPI